MSDLTWPQHRRPRRGQVGIGTLIVFISMVLVAAIAAGVLINTAGILQTQSQETGEKSTSQTTNRLQVISSVGGDINANDGTLGYVNLTVKRGPGAGDIDLRNATMTWVGPSGSYNLVESTTDSSSAGGVYAATRFKDSEDTHPVLTKSDDRVILTFDLGSDSVSGVPEFGQRLHRGDVVSVDITTESGATTQLTIGVPESLAGKSTVAL